MSDLQILGVMCVSMGAFFAVLIPFVVWIVRRSGAGLAAADAQLAAHAAARELSFAARPPRAWGMLAGAPTQIGISLDGPHGLTAFRTNVRVSVAAGAGVAAFEIQPRGVASAVVPLGTPAPTGDPTFDARFALTLSGSQLPALGDELRARLLAFPRELSAQRSPSGAVLSWPGREQDSAVLDEACALDRALSGPSGTCR